MEVARPWKGSDQTPLGVKTTEGWTTSNCLSIERTELHRRKNSSNSSNKSHSLLSIIKHLTKKKNCANNSHRHQLHRDSLFIRHSLRIMREPSRSKLQFMKAEHSWLDLINQTVKPNRSCWTLMTPPIVTPSLITAVDSRCSLWRRTKSTQVLETCMKDSCQRKRLLKCLQYPHMSGWTQKKRINR